MKTALVKNNNQVDRVIYHTVMSLSAVVKCGGLRRYWRGGLRREEELGIELEENNLIMDWVIITIFKRGIQNGFNVD